MNMKASTGILFTVEIAYLGNRDMKTSCFRSGVALRIVPNECTGQRGHDGNQVVCVDLLPIMVQV